MALCLRRPLSKQLCKSKSRASPSWLPQKDLPTTFKAGTSPLSPWDVIPVLPSIAEGREPPGDQEQALPTLFQHARGCSPWRPAADMGTARREIYTLSPGFSRASESSPDAAGTATLSKARAPLSGRTHSRAPCPSQRKENSPRGSRRLLRDRSRYRTGRLAAPISATPDSGI